MLRPMHSLADSENAFEQISGGGNLTLVLKYEREATEIPRSPGVVLTKFTLQNLPRIFKKGLSSSDVAPRAQQSSLIVHYHCGKGIVCSQLLLSYPQRLF